ncbi:MAG: hypothetical protein U1E65_22940 [Myxococcota bacterium]
MRALVTLAALTLAVACTDRTPVTFGQGKEGDACAQVSDCAAGLECRSDTCTPIQNEPDMRGKACSASASCGAGLCCGNQGVCRVHEPEFGAGMCGRPAGDPCGFPSDCDVGLICSSDGTCAAPGGAGTKGLGESCAVLADCQRPLVCGLDKKCDQLPLFGGVSCAKSEEDLGAFRMHFEVPRDPMNEEFFRHPFPSDVRRTADGHISMAGFPSPGEVLGVDFTKLYISAAEQDVDGFGLTAPIFVRFSDHLDPATLGVRGSTATIYLVGLSEGAPDYDAHVPLQLDYSAPRTQLICANHVAVAPIDGRPLAPHTTYGLILSNAIKSSLGAAPIQDGDFRKMLAATAPEGDAVLAAAYTAYAPLRAYVTRKGLDPSLIAGATVFTTGDPAKIAPKLRQAVRAAPAPAVTAVVKCDTGVHSPCEAVTDMRGCNAAAATHFELQGKVRLPSFQHGTKPFVDPGPNNDQGAFVLGADGVPAAQGSEEVCFGLSIPKSPMPAGGWPLLIYGHGTGGSYKSGLDSIAAEMASIPADGGGVLAHVAVLTFDNVMHGPRQGVPEAAWTDPGDLFFNIRNPRAARDNVLQGAADVMSLVRFAETATLSTQLTGLASVVRFDGAHILYYGHSQGTTIIPATLMAEPKLRAAVLTGAGGEIGLSVLEKKKPNDVSSATRVAFGDQNITRLHPAIGLLSLFFGPADAIPYAPGFRSGVTRGDHGLELLHIYGLRDGYTPESTQAAMMRAAGLPLVGTILRPLSGVSSVPTTPPPSFASAQFQPPAAEPTYDGHFVGSRDPVARRLIEEFIGTAATTAKAEVRR